MRLPALAGVDEDAAGRMEKKKKKEFMKHEVGYSYNKTIHKKNCFTAVAQREGKTQYNVLEHYRGSWHHCFLYLLVSSVC